jgi:hypothetical protein
MKTKLQTKLQYYTSLLTEGEVQNIPTLKMLIEGHIKCIEGMIEIENKLKQEPIIFTREFIEWIGRNQYVSNTDSEFTYAKTIEEKERIGKQWGVMGDQGDFYMQFETLEDMHAVYLLEPPYVMPPLYIPKPRTDEDDWRSEPDSWFSSPAIITIPNEINNIEE